MTYASIRSIIVVAAILFAFSGEAKLKGLPVMKDYKNYNLNKPNVESLKYTVYAAKVEGETVTTGDIVDFTAEVFFDEKGYRVKEIVCNMEGEVDVIINWQYDETGGTVIETRTDKNGNLLARTEYIVNYKLNTVVARRYENIEDHISRTTLTNVLRYEELWTENAKKKTVHLKKTDYDYKDGAPIRQSISELPLEKPYTLYLTLESITGQIDYTWLYDYNEKALKASSRASRNEPIYDSTKYEYRAKNKLLSTVLHFGKDKILKDKTNYTYSFDGQKNWTEIVQKENDIPHFVIRRKIKYRT
jgi:hypothetical protein